VEITEDSLIVIVAVAVLAPLLVDLTPRLPVPIVVAEMLLGIVVGPAVLGIAESDAFIEALASIGLAFLFFLAGLEIEFDRISGVPARLGASAWLISLALGIGIALVLWAAGILAAPVLAGLALTTTALGTLMPILRDSGVLQQRLGAWVLGAGAAGEFGPVLIVSLILAVESGHPARTVLLLVFAAVALVIAAVALKARPTRIVRLVNATMQTSGQFAVRLAVLLLAALVVLAADLGLDVILGAFVAGIIAGLALRDADSETFLDKLDAIGFGFFIPIFFITTGLDFDLDALIDHPISLAAVPAFAALFLLVRGFPTWLLYRRRVEHDELLPLALFSASALPLVVAITEIGTEAGVMAEQEASALVGAGMLSVLIYPVLALGLRARARSRSPAH
jgi:Kef-type K+ transport system membrane component KefB